MAQSYWLDMTNRVTAPELTCDTWHAWVFQWAVNRLHLEESHTTAVTPWITTLRC